MTSPPCADTFNRLFQALRPEAMAQLLQEVAERLRQKAGAAKTIAVDGKTLRGSTKGGKSIHVLNAWASGVRLSIGQLAVESKSNEITHVPQLLRSLDLRGCVVTADALNTQVSTVQTIVQGKEDSVLPLKANHPTHRGVVAAIMRDVAASRPPDLEQVEKAMAAWRRAAAGSPPTSPSSLRKTSSRASGHWCASTAPGVSPRRP